MNSRFDATRCGLVLPVCVPFPISPRGFASQQYAKPEMSAPQVVQVPTLSHAIAGEFGTSCGIGWLRVISSTPFRSNQTAPQQYTAPRVVRAHVRCAPELTEATGAAICTRTRPATLP